MRNIYISDVSLRESGENAALSLSFKEKLEIAKLLGRLGVDIVELPPVTDTAGEVLIRTIAGSLENAAISVAATPDVKSAEAALPALAKAKNARVNIIVPVSAVRMEYFAGLKPDAILRKVAETVARVVESGVKAEVTAEDATRAERAFLASVLTAAVEAGASYVTLCDSAGEMLPEEFAAFLADVKNSVPALSGVTLAAHCKDNLGLASACALAAVASGADVIKASAGHSGNTLPLEVFLGIVKSRGEKLGVTCGANFTAVTRICRQLETLTGGARSRSSAFTNAVGTDGADGAALNADTSVDTLRRRIEAMGYDVSEPDMERIYALFTEIARVKPVETRDVEALIADTASQAAPMYTLRSYVINSGSAITATACLTIMRASGETRALSVGDGPIDAAFLAIEDALGRKFELEDFQIHAVTEGREAMGDALVKLRAGGKLYSGRGLSTDIIGASIRAYLSAVNKIVFEERS